MPPIPIHPKCSPPHEEEEKIIRDKESLQEQPPMPKANDYTTPPCNRQPRLRGKPPSPLPSTVHLSGTFAFFFFLLPAPHKFEVQSLAMNKGEALIGRLPSISLAVVTITKGFVQVMHVHQGRLWGQVIPQVG